MPRLARPLISVPLPPLSSPRGGFTLFEVLVALILLSAGVGAFLGTSLLTTRLVVDAQAATRAMQAAGGRLEQLRALALTAPMHCAALSDGADSTVDGIRVAWRVRALGQLSEVTVVVAQPSRLARGTDSVTALLRCP